MSIENHKWSDEDLSLFDTSESEYAGLLFSLRCNSIMSSFSDFYINKQDAIAIAKHFNVDNESLVEGIKELINSVDCSSCCPNTEVFSIDDLQKLITKEDIEE
jgi:hypothetical protein